MQPNSPEDFNQPGSSNAAGQELPADYFDGTSSGSTAEEDPPSGGPEDPPRQSVAGIVNKVPCPFRMARLAVNKNQSPLFGQYPGAVQCYVPYYGQHEFEPGKYEQVVIAEGASHIGVNVYMSEVVVMYQENGLPTPATAQSRTHIFLGQSLWLPRANTQHDLGWSAGGEFPARVDVEPLAETQFVIHELRPVFGLDPDWGHSAAEAAAGREAWQTRIPTVANPCHFPPNGSTTINSYIVVARPVSWELKAINNIYAVGILTFTNGKAPQLYQKVNVYLGAGEANANEAVAVYNNGQEQPVAVFRAAPLITIAKDQTLYR